MWYIHTRKYQSVLKTKRNPDICYKRWKELNNIMLYEINKTQRKKYYMIPTTLGIE